MIGDESDPVDAVIHIQFEFHWYSRYNQSLLQELIWFLAFLLPEAPVRYPHQKSEGTAGTEKIQQRLMRRLIRSRN